ncbi:MAG TPA: MogA/MoaB family molybdenum cofactor biosynthesis protein [Terriglobia bacterium]|nr:MogA/MoaB family molybdenum cofactor biosynthesis protein [Terriglobia bacterium]
MMTHSLRAKILVLSDRTAEGRREDASGLAVRDVLESHGWQVVALDVLPDDEEQIRDRLKDWTETDDCDAVFTTGGTGLGPRDVTPEATRSVIAREVPGLAELMRAQGVKSTPRAALSRGVVGTRKGKLIVNLPGSPRGARESVENIVGILAHAIDQVQGRTEHSEP